MNYLLLTQPSIFEGVSSGSLGRGSRKAPGEPGETRDLDWRKDGMEF